MKILTFIIPTRNRFQSLSKIVNEIRNLNIDIIIIDDNSNLINKKKNFLLSKKIKKIKYFYLKKNLGQSFALNIGVKHCKTKYVWFFDDDDFINKNSVLNVVDFLLKKKVEGLLVPMYTVYKGCIINKIFPKAKEHKFNKLINGQQKVSTSCSIFDSQIIKKIGGWDPKLASGTDTDIFLRFSKKYKFSVFNKAFVEVNYSASNRVTNNLTKQLIGKIQILIKHGQILSFKRILYYIFTLVTFYPLFYNIKQNLRLAQLKKNV
tara:strand:- start:555 stop:1343 length:789 start_codon:yes stop_codon:yes gene_type:complete